MTKKVFRIHVSTMLLILSFLNLDAQQLSEGNNLSMTKTIPVSPEAASLGKYGEIPTSSYTGIPSISIPIHEVTSGDLSLPISLSYHAGGIKVEEIASWVGLGWSLNAGGVITRSIRGIADERDQLTPYGHYREVFNFIQSEVDEQDKNEVYALVEAGVVDLESDIYHFNFGGYSGKFHMDADPTNPSRLIPVLIPKEAFKITYEENSNDEIFRWVITTPDGVKYVFGRSFDGARDGIEKNESYSVCFQDYGSLNPGNTDELTSSWHLIEAISPKGFRVDFYYENFNYRFRTFGSENAQLILPGTPTPGPGKCEDRITECYVRNQMRGKRLTAITYLNGSVEFEANDKFRTDFCQSKSLKSITIFGEDEVEYLKKFNLIQGYFHPSGVQEPEDLVAKCGDANSDNGAEFRLKLEEIYEEDFYGNTKPPHIFTYEELINLPPRLPFDGINSHPTAHAQDHWGYYNGQHLNQRKSGIPTLIPSFYETYFDLQTGDEKVYYFDGADRTSNSFYAKANTLTSITYPTGGSTGFLYDGNTISSDQIPIAYTLVQNSREVGPFNYSSDDQNDPPQDYVVFTINSDLERFGVFGADVETRLHERATQPGECGGPGSVLNEGEWIVNRYIYDANTNTEVYSNDTQDGETFFLPNGDYYVRLERKHDITTNCHSDFSLLLKWVEMDDGRGPVSNVEVGGLRVREIRNSDGISSDNDLVITHDYNRFDDSGLSSGVLTTFPYYAWKFYVENHIVSTGGTTNSTYTCPFFISQSNSFYPLATTKGGLVGYENVTEVQGGTSSAGKTEFTYTTAREFPDNLVPLAPANSFDWRRGLLKKSSMYKEESGIYATVQEHEYDHERQDLETSLGVKLITVSKTSTPGASLNTSVWNYSEYGTSTEWQYRSEQISKNNYNDDESIWVEILNEYKYSPTHFQMTETSQVESDGTTLITRWKYPKDIDEETSIPTLPTDDQGRGLRAMLDQHILVSPIETRTIRKENLSEYLLSGKVISYKEDGGVVSPYEEYFLETMNPIFGSQAVSYISNTGLDFDPNYESRVKYSKVNEQGQVLEYTDSNGITTVLLWGYNGEYPVAKIEGASYVQVESVLGTGFSLESGGVALDETQCDLLRSIQGTLVQTYTYEIGRGVSTITDSNGYRTTYQYDAFGRLFQIRDHYDKVIKQYEYNYAND